MSKQALQKAVDIAGGQTALARAIGVKQGHVWAWLNRGIPVPPEHLPAIESTTAGQVTAADLRPDLAEIFGAEEAPAA